MITNKICVKISIYSKDGIYCEEVIYLQGNMTIDFALRWKWYWEYLAALVKVRNPRRKVEMYFGNQGCLLGEDWIIYRTKTLLTHRKSKLAQLQNQVLEHDLFGFAEKDKERNLDKVKKDIEELENKKYPIPEFPEYINKIKKWI